MKNGAATQSHAGSMHVLFRQTPTEEDQHFVEVRQWLTADGDYGDLIVEQGFVQDDDDLHTDLHVLPFYLSVEQALSEVIGRKGE